MVPDTQPLSEVEQNYPRVEQLRELVASGLSSSEAVDYYFVVEADIVDTHAEWAEHRGVSREAVTQNIRQARETLAENHPIDANLVKAATPPNVSEHDVHAALTEIDEALRGEWRRRQDDRAVLVDEVRMDEPTVTEINRDYPNTLVENDVGGPEGYALKVPGGDGRAVYVAGNSVEFVQDVHESVRGDTSYGLWSAVFECHDYQADRIAGYEVSVWDRVVVVSTEGGE